MKTKILNNGCIVDENNTQHLKHIWIDVNSVYRLNHRCNNSLCFNPNHITYTLLYELIPADKDDPEIKLVNNKSTVGHRIDRMNMELATEIREQLKQGKKIVTLAKKYCVSEMCISRIKNNRSWTGKPKTTVRVMQDNTKYVRDNKNQVWDDYLRLRSMRALANKYDVSTYFLRELFKEELKTYDAMEHCKLSSKLQMELNTPTRYNAPKTFIMRKSYNE